jgi:Fur family ferric uptake transcriptional regulator
MKKGDALSARTRVLHGAGLRKTGPRLAVLGVLEQAKAPVSHGEVADALTRAGLDRATVYRNLLALTEAGIVRRTDLGDHVWRFELVSGSSSGARGKNGRDHGHPHFVCSDCGTVSCLPKVKIRFDGPQAALAKRGVEVQLRGRCGGCGPASPASRPRRAAAAR